MARRLPPLGALRAFEAAARHLSFAKAAEELHVTPAAVSHQVKALEEHLGQQLFRRFNRAVLLSEPGQRLLPGLRDGFDRLAEAVDRLRTADARGPLTVTVAPGFAAKWLVPRLDRFQTRHPDIEVRIDAAPQVIDLTREEVDIAIRYGAGKYPGLRVDRLLPEEVSPVCSPHLLQGPHPLREPKDLRSHTLIHSAWGEDDSSPDWRMWLLAAGVRDVDWTRGPRFGEYNLAIDAAIAGQGVALASGVLAGADLAAGRLVKPFALSMPSDFAYFVVSLMAAAERPKVKAFREWLFAEAKLPAPGRIID